MLEVLFMHESYGYVVAWTRYTRKRLLYYMLAMTTIRSHGWEPGPIHRIR